MQHPSNFNNDNEVLEAFNSQDNWGICLALDLKDCDLDLIRSEEKIKQFVVELCNLIDMKRFGETVVVNFGEDPRVSGFSMTQLIETSLISGHFANQTNAAYIDIFSCKFYPPFKATEFAKEFFKAKSVNQTVFFRQA